jgi:hypothetical protein
MDQIIPSAFLAFVKASTEIQGISLFDWLTDDDRPYHTPLSKDKHIDKE